MIVFQTLPDDTTALVKALKHAILVITTYSVSDQNSLFASISTWIPVIESQYFDQSVRKFLVGIPRFTTESFSHKPANSLEPASFTGVLSS